MSVSVPTWVTPQTAVPQAAPVVTEVDALAAEVLPCASRATTVYEYAVFAARPLSTNVVAGGFPVTVPTAVPPRRTS